MTSEREVYVYIQLPGTLASVTAGILRVQTLPNGTNVGRFRYGNRYLERQDALPLDPFSLPLSNQIFEVTVLKGIPGAIRDAAPDAWGRRVIEYALERSSSDLHEVDYLLHGPQDGAGWLSFGLGAVPPPPMRRYNRTRQLAQLVAAAHAVEQGKPLDKSLLLNLEPGTSMGGARPKASIEDAQGLWLGKFPAGEDRCNLQRIEFATLELARRCGIHVPLAKIQTLGAKDVLMLKRFDRERSGSGYLRYGMVSGLTVLGCDDHYLDRSRWSYPLLSDQLRRWSVRTEKDSVELFRRMVFNAAITNNDDHPRNHAFLYTRRGWCLSPAYDLVPTPTISLERRDLALTVGQYGRTASIYNILSQADRFGLSTEAAQNLIAEMVQKLRAWRDVFVECGVSAKDIEYIESAMLPESFFRATPNESNHM